MPMSDKKKRPLKGRLHNLMLAEVSLVDRPANPHAHVTLVKRAEEEIEESHTELVDGILKVWYGADPQTSPPKSFTDTIRDHLLAENQHELLEVISPLIYALDDSLSSITRDVNMSAEGKQQMMRESTEQFLATVASKWPEAEANMNKAFTDHKGEDDMPASTKEELQKQIDALTQKLNDVTTASDDAKKVAEMSDELAGLKKQQEELTAKAAEAADALKKAETERDAAIAKAGMSDAERAHLETLSEDDAAKFVAMSPAERKKVITKAAEDDEVLKIGDTEVRKSAVGETQFAVMKSQQERIEKQEAEIAKQRDAVEMATLEKRADDEYGHLPGDTKARAGVLKAMAAMPEDTRKALETILNAAEKVAKSAYDRVGHHQKRDGANGDDFLKKVAEIKKRDSVPQNEAMARARKEFPEEFAAYQEDGERIAAN